MIEADRIREAAREVLGRPAYDELDPSLAQDLFGRVRSLLADALDAVLGSTAAGGLGRVVAYALIGLVVVGAVVLLLGLRRRSEVDAVVEVATHRDARALLAEAEAASGAGDHEAAVRARYGALVLLLVEAGVLAARPGLTVGEVDEAVVAGAPAAAPATRVAGGVLADVVYGGRPATSVEDAQVGAGVTAVAAAVGRRDLLPRTVGAGT